MRLIVVLQPRDGLSALSRSLRTCHWILARISSCAGTDPASVLRKLILRIDNNQGLHGISSKSKNTPNNHYLIVEIPKYIVNTENTSVANCYVNV